MVIIPYQMKPLKISNESPFFTLQDGVFNERIRPTVEKLQ